MKKLIVILLFIAFNASAQTNEAKLKTEVTAAVELFRQTLIKPNKAVFEKLTFEKLNYGHSSGFLEARDVFIEAMVSGKYKFTAIEQSNQTIDISGTTAIVRHSFVGNTHDAGKEPGVIKFNVLQIWQKKAQGWILIARQGFKVI